MTVSFDTNLRPVLWPSTQEMIDVTHEMVALADIGAARGQRGAGAARHQGPARDRPHATWSMGASTVIVKDGGARRHRRSPGKRCCTATSFPVQVVDTVGAGDGFAAGFISGTLDRLTARGCLRRAAAVGAMATTSPGDRDGLPTRLELTTFLQDHSKRGKRASPALAVAR